MFPDAWKDALEYVKTFDKETLQRRLHASETSTGAVVGGFRRPLVNASFLDNQSGRKHDSLGEWTWILPRGR